ncbi:hypothetical protein PPTG_10809 [Phytophthora nicotianae INRA-310]|uniref:Uncharacterized protein n=1 Tax=Phytophthora nicotianae (strain INRA-310) TaxID=761204 RepID=W2QB31_PHYN3|nr:hypothetical protein PPTG_10809 [Phytophthora nicotianae INRA-310]ETN10076.1 hypothetical protein PPTG_10809 [Phytophthora nicotianae INRA-310]
MGHVPPDATPRDGGAASAPVRIMSALANYPDLLETYASQFQQLGLERNRPRVQAISDSVLMTPRYEDGGDRRHNFGRPKPTTAVLSQLYDFDFGVCGLSILHFRRFNLNAQLDHAGLNAVNLINVSVKVSLPSPPVNPSHDSLCDSLSILKTYAEEFFDAPTRRLITTAKAFSEELNDYAPWSPEEVKAVAFWFSKVSGEHRRATEFDISHGTSTRSERSRWFCMQDSELSGMLLKLSRGRDQIVRNAKRELHEPPMESSDRPSYRSNRENSRQVTRQHLPIAVTKAAPRLNGKQVCLRCIPANGCPSKVSDRCTNEFLGHFTPDTLAPIVQGYVVEKYGGLSFAMSSRV